MMNRAKCKLCKSIVESIHSEDYVECKCGEIYVASGDEMLCGANKWENFLRVDQDGNEIIVKIKNSSLKKDENLIIGEKEKENTQEVINSRFDKRKQILNLILEMIKTIENFTPIAMSSSPTHYDLLSVLLVLSEICRLDCIEDN